MIEYLNSNDTILFFTDYVKYQNIKEQQTARRTPMCILLHTFWVCILFKHVLFGNTAIKLEINILRAYQNQICGKFYVNGLYDIKHH